MRARSLSGVARNVSASSPLTCRRPCSARSAVVLAFDLHSSMITCVPQLPRPSAGPATPELPAPSATAEAQARTLIAAEAALLARRDAREHPYPTAPKKKSTKKGRAEEEPVEPIAPADLEQVRTRSLRAKTARRAGMAQLLALAHTRGRPM